MSNRENKIETRKFCVIFKSLRFEMSKKCIVIVVYLLSKTVLCLISVDMTQYTVLNNTRCGDVTRMLSPAFYTHHFLRCIAACQATTDCNSVNFAQNESENSCETLQISELDFCDLDTDVEWNFYSSLNLSGIIGV